MNWPPKTVKYIPYSGSRFWKYTSSDLDWLSRLGVEIKEESFDKYMDKVMDKVIKEMEWKMIYG